MTQSIRRPRLLSRAARAGAPLYKRERDLSRLLPKFIGKGAGVLQAIRAAEAICENERRAGAASYSISRHVSLLSALVAETGRTGHHTA